MLNTFCPQLGRKKAFTLPTQKVKAVGLPRTFVAFMITVKAPDVMHYSAERKQEESITALAQPDCRVFLGVSLLLI